MSINFDELAGDLAYVRSAIAALQQSTPGSVDYDENVVRLVAGFQCLDNGEAFREIDEHTSYERPSDTLDRIKAANSRFYQVSSSHVTVVPPTVYRAMMSEGDGDPHDALHSAAERASALIRQERASGAPW